MPPSDRTKVFFHSGNDRCAAWHYAGTNGACVVMAGGLAVTKEPGTDRFAGRFHQAGYSVLAFDYRGFGESEGRPRQVARIADQLADWTAAIARARDLPEVKPDRLALWGHSSSGGHVLCVAASSPGIAAAIAFAPLADGPAVAPSAMCHQTLQSSRVMWCRSSSGAAHAAIAAVTSCSFVLGREIEGSALASRISRMDSSLR